MSSDSREEIKISVLNIGACEHRGKATSRSVEGMKRSARFYEIVRNEVAEASRAVTHPSLASSQTSKTRHKLQLIVQSRNVNHIVSTRVVLNLRVGS